MPSRITFPRATVEFAISNAKLSPFSPSAIKLNGLFPVANSADRGENVVGEAFVNAKPYIYMSIKSGLCNLTASPSRAACVE